MRPRHKYHLPLFWRILTVVLIAGLAPLLTLSIFVQQSLQSANNQATSAARKGLDDRTLDAGTVQARLIAKGITDLLDASVQDTLSVALIPRTPDTYKMLFSDVFRKPITYPGVGGGAQSTNIPLYSELAYINAAGRENIHITLDPQNQPTAVSAEQLRDVSIPANTTYKTEIYFAQAKALPIGQVYVSHMFAWHTSLLDKQPTRSDEGTPGSNFGRYSGVIRFATPVFTPQGAFDGVVVLSLDVRHIIERVVHASPTTENETILWPNYGSGNYAYMWDDQGYLLAHPLIQRWRGVGADGNLLPTWPNTKIPDSQKDTLMYRMGIGDAPQPEMYADTLKGISGSKTYTNLAGATKVNIYVPISFDKGEYKATGIFGGLVLGANQVEYHRDADVVQQKLLDEQVALQNRIYIIFAIAALFLVIFVVVVSRSITAPVARLRGVVRKVERGQMDDAAIAGLDPLINIPIQDEIVQFAGVFKQMILNLRQRETELEASQAMLAEYNTNLENLVRKRTAQLESANAEIVGLNTKLEAENLRMSAELNITRRLQQMLLPKDNELNSIPGLDVAGFMEPAEEVGGDYYDVLRENGRIKIGIGDVTGHGLESGVMMLMVQTAVRTLLNTAESDPATFLNVINHTIYENVNRMRSDKNLTLAIIDYSDDGNLVLSGQHEEMIVVRANGEVEMVDTLNLGFPIGLEEDISAFVSQISVKLEPGDVVVLYTDGVTEAENADKKLYGIERLSAAVKANHTRSAVEIKSAIIADVKAYIGTSKVYDDITLLVLKQKG